MWLFGRLLIIAICILILGLFDSFVFPMGKYRKWNWKNKKCDCSQKSLNQIGGGLGIVDTVKQPREYIETPEQKPYSQTNPETYPDIAVVKDEHA